MLEAHREVLAQGRRSPEPPLIPREALRDQTDPSEPLPAHEAFSSTPEAPWSPVRRFLSCVHITLSSRVGHSELLSAGTGNGIKVWDQPQGKAQASKAAPEASVGGVAAFPAAEGVLEDPSSAVPGPSQGLQGRARGSSQLLGGSGAQGVPSSAPPARPGRRKTSDAATQITTESPTKATFSAEICVDPELGGSAAQQPSLPRAPSSTIPSHMEIPPFPRQPAQPLLLPYKPWGSSGMYYVPFQRSAHTLAPGEAQASGDSPHPGSEDAPAGLLGTVLPLRDDPPAPRAAAQLRGDTQGPRLAWPEERLPLERSPELPGRPKSGKPSRCIPEPARLPLPRPVPGSSCLDARDLSGDTPGAGHAVPSLARAPGHQWGTGEEFSAVPAEADGSRKEDPASSGCRAGGLGLHPRVAGLEMHPRAPGTDPWPGGHAAPHGESLGKAAGQRSSPSGSLGELWLKFLERQRRQQEPSRNGELSLVQRLDRLARLLQSPVRISLAPAAAGEEVPEQEIQGKERTGTRVMDRARPGSPGEPRAAPERPRVIHGKNSPGEKAMEHLGRILEQQQLLEAPSDSSSEPRLSGDPSRDPSTGSTPGWDVGSLVGLDSSEGSSSLSLSSIDTARLLRAFGEPRLGLAPPQLSPKLSPRLAQLYRAIRQQKSRSERWQQQQSRGAGAEGPQGAAGTPRKGQQDQSTIPFSDSSGASSSSWGPSSALTSKRRTRMLNKSIQAGELEIVSSGTRRHTRDVGVTFPTPRSSQHLQQPPGLGGRAGAWPQPQALPSSLPMARSTKRSRLHLLPGTPWLVPAEDLKRESRKENQLSGSAGPGPAWFEPWGSTKPWREPLRERNWEEQQPSPGAAAAPAAARGLGQPLAKLTLQEALALHRPDFISRSGQRLRRLRLLREERRLQRLLQEQREQLLQEQREKLLQPPGKRKDCRSANHLVPNRGFLMKEKRRAIPRREMFQRSKRMYEQLPEVRKKREEEQRRLDYNSYRLRAQLYKTKITNRVLGKKVSWS